MKTQPQLSNALAGAFTAAVLLSGHTAVAEEAVANAILFTEADGVEGDAFLLRVLDAAIEASGQESQDVSRLLPPHLRSVLHLPRALRHCYVLRVLLTLPERTCAQLLHLESNQIRRFVSIAAVQLATLS